MEHIVGRPSRLPKGADATDRLAQVRGIWQGQSVAPQLQQYAHNSLQSLYDAIIMNCHPSHAASSMTSGALIDLLPRAPNPELGMTLGQGTMPVHSRLGGRLERGQHTEAPAATLLGN